MRRWLVVGAGGMLGSDLVPLLREQGHHVTAATRADLDILDEAACRSAATGHDVIVNCAAYTAVDAAETDEAAAFTVNGVGAANLARVSRTTGARLVHVSTDYVFPGDATTPYAEQDPIAPRTAYGRTKAAGEWAVQAYAPDGLIVRTAWLYGGFGPNFVATMARLAREQDTISVVDDQRGQPTWTLDLAQAIIGLVDAEADPGIWHGTSAGETTWFGFARAVFEGLGYDPERVQPTNSATMTRPAPRPAYSVLGHDRWLRAGLVPPGPWHERLRCALAAGYWTT